MTAVDLAYDDVGEGPVVVLLHGHPFNRSMWAPQLDALREHFRVIAPDLRGYGDSPVTAGTVTMAQLAATSRAFSTPSRSAQPPSPASAWAGWW